VDQGTFLWLLVITVGQIVQIVVGLASLRRKPPIAEEIYRDFATKAELCAMREEFRQTLSEYFQRQHINQSAIDDKFQAIMRSVGEIEGQLRRCPYFCKEVRQ